MQMLSLNYIFYREDWLNLARRLMYLVTFMRMTEKQTMARLQRFCTTSTTLSDSTSTLIRPCYMGKTTPWMLGDILLLVPWVWALSWA